MKKFYLALTMLVLLVTAAIASVNVLNDGTNLGPAQDINITGGSVSGNGPLKTVALGTATVTSGTINGATIGATSPSSGVFTSLTATGVITDVALYSRDAAAYPVRPMLIGADGTMYGRNTSAMIVDGGVYVAAAGKLGVGIASPTQKLAVDGTIYIKPSSLSSATGVTGAKTLWLNADGTIYLN